MNILTQIITDLNLQPAQVENTVALLNEGATVPFIARYRKERTGSLDEIQIRDIQHKYDYYKELDERRATILDSIRDQGKLTPDLEKKITDTLSKTELEDLYLPYKPKRVTRGKKARDAGLEPLARWMVDLQDPSADLNAEAGKYLNAEAGFDTPEKALQGASDILAEDLSDDAEVRKWLRELAQHEGQIISAVKKEFEGQKTKFDMYHAYKEKVATLVSHRTLAMLRGEREGVLRLELDFPKDKAVGYLAGRLIKNPGSAAEATLRATAQDALDRLLSLATETEIRNELRELAEAEAYKVFAENLRELLMAPPAGQKPTLGLDPGFRTGCKMVALDSTGKLLHYAAIFPHEPQKDVDGARVALLAFIQKYGIQLVAIGNGTAGRETEAFVRETIADIPPEMRPICVMVNESGASVYSASDVAIKEFPDHDVTVRGAVSIARRLQDPLSELVKIDPKAIGVGQYQHDVNQPKLRDRLEETVESCVNLVGVNVNLASEELLKYVSGLNRSIASGIVKHRNENGAYGARADLMKVPGMGAKKFEQAAGFLRIPGAANPLDNSSVHPERYAFVAAMAEKLGQSIESLISNSTVLRSIDKQSLVTGDIGLPTIEDILAELEKPGRDPRRTFEYAKFNDAVKEIKDLTEGMWLQGSVTNVANFGAFVDIGVHQDGLVHISELADRFVKDPRDVVKVGQVVNVRVVKVDKDLKRIALSMKKEEEKRNPESRIQETGEGRSQDRPRPRPQARAPHPSQPALRTPEPNRGPVTSHQSRGTSHQSPPPRPPAPKRPPATLDDLKKQWTGSSKSARDQEKKLKTVKPKFSVKQLLG